MHVWQVVQAGHQVLSLTVDGRHDAAFKHNQVEQRRHAEVLDQGGE